MGCKDCLHRVACLDWCKGFGDDAKLCEHFTPRTDCAHLPCKAGDTIFLPWEWHGENGIAQITVLRVVLTEDESYVETDFDSDDYDYFMKYNCGRFWFEDFGKTVFATKEDAKKALMGRGKNDL